MVKSLLKEFFTCKDEDREEVETKLFCEINKICNSKEVKNFVVSTRRELHKVPELMYQESKTSQIVQSKLKELDVPYSTGWSKNIHQSKEMPGKGGFGVVGHVGKKMQSPNNGCVLLRADMDALPVNEEIESDFKSSHEGCMHACGHDTHMAMLLGAAKVLKELGLEDDEELMKDVGSVRLMFQPAEEGGAGAKRMREEGVLSGLSRSSENNALIPQEQLQVKHAYGMHVWPTLPSGVIASRPGPLMAAACQFNAFINGVGGHAAMPHLTVDPVPVACTLISNLQTLVSRVISPLETGVVSITYFHGGDGAYNVIPKEVELRGTIRALSTDILLDLRNRIEKICQGISEANNCTVTIGYPMPDYYPPTINDPELYHELSSKVASRISVEKKVRDDILPTMGGEDFSFIAESVPSTFFWLGTGGTPSPCCPSEDGHEEKKTDYGLHHPKFAVDEDVLTKGVELHVSLAIETLRKIMKEQQ